MSKESINYNLIKFYLENEKKWDAFEYLNEEVKNFPVDIGNIVNGEDAKSLFSLLEQINNNRDILMEGLAERLNRLKKELGDLNLKIQRGRKGKKYFYTKLTKKYYNDKINFMIYLLGNSFEAVKVKNITCWLQLYIHVDSKNTVDKYSKKLKYFPKRHIYNYIQYKEYEEDLSNKNILVRLFPLTEINNKMFDNCINSIQSYLKQLTGK